MMQRKFRVIFVDLHINGFYVQDLKSILQKRRMITKHRFILDWLINNQVEICNLVTINGTSLPVSVLRKVTSNFIFRKIEAAYVLKRNKISSKKITIITDPSLIGKDDVVIYYSTFGVSQYDNIDDVHGIKIVDHVHFYGDREKADLLKNKGFRFYMYEVDLKRYSKLYQKNYNWFDGDLIVRPYSYEPRFQETRCFRERKMKAVAIGTLTKCRYPEFIEMYGTEYYQPHRKMILDHAKEYPDELDSYISEFEEKKLLEAFPYDSFFTKLYKKLYNFYNAGKQKSYFSFDMVEKFNEYKMFICPEDINGSYGVGTIEGMACGCAMIGWNYGAFEDMGMEAGKHYISYDGTMEDLIEKIRYYQKPENQMELENIAKTGCSFVRENFSQGKVAQNLYETLKRISEESENNINAD